MRRNLLAVLVSGLMSACSPPDPDGNPTPVPAAAPFPESEKSPAAEKAPAAEAAPAAEKLPAEVAAPAVAPGQTPALATQADKVSYAIGQNIGLDLKRQELEMNQLALAQGIADAMSAATPLMSEQEVQETLMSFQKERQTAQAEKAKVLGETNKNAGEAFLAQNKTKEGVVTLPSGLQYRILKEGTGKTPTAESNVTTNYRGTLIDGTEFDSSYKRGEPATFGCSGVIKGWTEALLLMKEGSKWELFIPAELAYGPQQRGPKIGPNSTLLFELELISVQ